MAARAPAAHARRTPRVRAPMRGSATAMTDVRWNTHGAAGAVAVGCQAPPSSHPVAPAEDR